MNNSHSKIRVEENGKYQFDFSTLAYVLEFHDVAHRLPLSDVDFITETKQEILFIEYKNASVEGASKPDAMLRKIKHGDFYQKISRKFYDSLLLFWASEGNENELPISYVLLIEHPIIDKRLRRQLQLKIEKQLPFNLPDKRLKKELISSFKVLNLEEWSSRYPFIPITLLE